MCVCDESCPFLPFAFDLQILCLEDATRREAIIKLAGPERQSFVTLLPSPSHLPTSLACTYEKESTTWASTVFQGPDFHRHDVPIAHSCHQDPHPLTSCSRHQPHQQYPPETSQKEQYHPRRWNRQAVSTQAAGSRRQRTCSTGTGTSRQEAKDEPRFPKFQPT